MIRESASSHPLIGVHVLVTRPAHQAEHLVQLIERAGGAAIQFPTLEIAPPHDPIAFDTIVDRLTQFDTAIFISPNAVYRALEVIHRRGGMPSKLRIACIGAGSARALKDFGIEPIVPKDRFDSEALLSLPEFREVTDQRIVIFRGEGGREHLGQILTARGAHIEYAECYRRSAPQASTKLLTRRWERGEIDIVTVTSAESLCNLHNMVDPADRRWLLKTPIVVVSTRQAQLCHELGFTHPAIVAHAATDEAILDALTRWRSS